MDILHKIVLDKRTVLKQLLASSNPARSLLIPLLQATPVELTQAIINAHYGLPIFQSNLTIHKLLMPKIETSDELFQYITDLLKRSI